MSEITPERVLDALLTLSTPAQEINDDLYEFIYDRETAEKAWSMAPERVIYLISRYLADHFIMIRKQ